MTTAQSERANLFKSLHTKGEPLILFNVWDAGSARAIEEIGAKAIATGSLSVAAAHGYGDGQELPLDMALANLKRIIATVDLPVTIDLEGGYGDSSNELQESVTRVIEAGAVGINFEDQIVGGTGLYSMEGQRARIEAIRDAAEQARLPLFINARTDIFLKADPSSHAEEHLEEAIRRAKVYAEAGASGFFAPGLRNAKFIERLCKASALPVNILVMPDVPSSKQLAALGVARISFGPGPYRLVIEALKEAGRKALSMS
ncbi:MAG: isocitrate lyase/phosphoenolpyruvate mutase family protein [Pyrinomonadaceae bacterium]|nr:isocitrate lyase/phosphoenolpyruvate mutase family protein [Pyrinomonadaceae bacterium]